MRILLYNDISGPWGGVESHIQVLLAELKRVGYEVKLFAFAERLPSRRGLADKLRFLRRSQSYDSRLASVLRSRLRDFQPDLIHSHNNRLFTATVCRELERYEAPILSSLHDHDLLDFASQPYSLKAHIKRRQFRMIRQVSQQVSVPTRRMQQQMGQLGLPATYLPYFLSEREWGSGFAERQAPEQIQLLYVGRMIRPKGIFRLLEALDSLVQQGCSPRLTCVGDGPDREAFEQQANLLGLRNLVETTGFLAPGEVRFLMQQSTCLLLPSEYEEVFGIVGIEAQAMGLPCVASNAGGISEWCRDGWNGLLVPPGDVKALSLAILRIHHEGGLSIRYQKNGLQHQRTHFSAEAVMPALLETYEDLLTKKAAYPVYGRWRKPHLPVRRDYMPAGSSPTDYRCENRHPHLASQDDCYTS